MSSTVDQLRELSNSELFIMCHKYQFAAREIAYLTRRQLERRLHVAILGERAKWRAHDLMHRILSQKQHSDFNAWLGVNRIAGPIPDRQVPLRRPAARRQTMSLPNFQRVRGGVEPFMRLEQLRQHSEDSATLSQHDEVDESVGSDSDRSDHTELTDEQKQHWWNVFQNQEQPMESINTDYIDWDAALDVASDYYSLSESEENENNIPFEESTERISNNLIHKREVQLWTTSTPNFSLLPKPEEVSLAEEPISENRLQKAQQLCTPSTHNFILPESDDEADCTHERLLCTFNYMEDLLSINKKSSKEFFDKGNSEHIVVGDTLLSSQTRPSHRRTLWRYVFNMICCDSQGKLDAGKVRYSILCCAMVICTYVGFKMLQ